MVIIGLAALEADNCITEGFVERDVRAGKLSVGKIAGPRVVLGRVCELATS
jgi:hypothetical protein